MHNPIEHQTRQIRQLLSEKAYAQVLQIVSSIQSSQNCSGRIEGLDYWRALAFMGINQKASAVEALTEELRYFPDNTEAAKLLHKLQNETTAGRQTQNREFEQIAAQVRHCTMVGHASLLSLYERAKSVCLENIPGHFVECGTAAGGSAALMAAVIRQYSKRPRLLFCFDTFAGAPEPSEEDFHRNTPAGATGRGAAACIASEQSLLDICSRLDVRNIVVPIKGLFKDTLPKYKAKIGKIAFLHLQMGDNGYAQTLNILENLYDQIVAQGCVQAGNYGHWEGCKKALHEFEARRSLRLELHAVDKVDMWFTIPAHPQTGFNAIPERATSLQKTAVYTHTGRLAEADSVLSGMLAKPAEDLLSNFQPHSAIPALPNTHTFRSPEVVPYSRGNTLNPEDIEWIGVRFLDTVSRSFKYAGKFYKAIFPSALKHIQMLYHRGIFDDLMSNKQIPEMQPSKYQVDGFPLLLEQETESFNFGSDHWNPIMLKDAALKYIEISKYLLSKNLILKDGHTSNFIFQENSIPKWCDIGSIIAGGNQSMAGLREFIQFFVYPLMIRQKSNHLARISRYFSRHACTEEEALQIGGKTISFHAGRREVLESLEQIVLGIDFSWPQTTWSSYHGDLSQKEIDVYDIDKGEDCVSRNNMVKRLLLALKPATVLDIGSNAGYYSLLAAQAGAEVLALEPDETAAAKCYQNFKRFDQLKAKVAMAGAGFTGGHTPDLTIALALTHHMFFTGMYRLEIIARVLAACTQKALITEFMTNGLGGHTPIPCPLPENYKLDIFLRELVRYFKIVEYIDPPRPSATYSHRIFIFAQNKIAD